MSPHIEMAAPFSPELMHSALLEIKQAFLSSLRESQGVSQQTVTTSKSKQHQQAGGSQGWQWPSSLASKPTDISTTVSEMKMVMSGYFESQVEELNINLDMSHSRGCSCLHLATSP